MMSRVLAVLFLLVGFATAQANPAVVERIYANPPFAERSGSRFSRTRENPENAFVSASELAIPAHARKEFDKGIEALHKYDLEHARQHFGKAVDLYPKFPSAYNNLGVVFARLGQLDREREALQTALQLNDHFELAYVNWGRMDITEHNFGDAETALRKASSLNETDPVALILLAYSELMQGHLQAAIGDSQKAHGLSKPHAFVHRIAARAYEQQKQFERAIAELKVSLDEEPTGSRADAARQELQMLQKIVAG
jgi:tetratricopeptide (TPR) repeat protein